MAKDGTSAATEQRRKKLQKSPSMRELPIRHGGDLIKESKVVALGDSQNISSTGKLNNHPGGFLSNAKKDKAITNSSKQIGKGLHVRSNLKVQSRNIQYSQAQERSSLGKANSQQSASALPGMTKQKSTPNQPNRRSTLQHNSEKKVNKLPSITVDKQDSSNSKLKEKDQSSEFLEGQKDEECKLKLETLTEVVEDFETVQSKNSRQ